MRIRKKGNILIKILCGIAAAAVVVLAVLTLIGRLTTRYVPAIFAAGAFFFLTFAFIRPEPGERKIQARERVYFVLVAFACLVIAAFTAVTVWELM